VGLEERSHAADGGHPSAGRSLTGAPTACSADPPSGCSL
jgi:hypothetical protein